MPQQSCYQDKSEADNLRREKLLNKFAEVLCQRNQRPCCCSCFCRGDDGSPSPTTGRFKHIAYDSVELQFIVSTPVVEVTPTTNRHIIDTDTVGNRRFKLVRDYFAPCQVSTRAAAPVMQSQRVSSTPVPCCTCSSQLANTRRTSRAEPATKSAKVCRAEVPCVICHPPSRSPKGWGPGATATTQTAFRCCCCCCYSYNTKSTQPLPPCHAILTSPCARHNFWHPDCRERRPPRRSDNIDYKMQW